MNKDPKTRPFGQQPYFPPVGYATMHIDGGCRPTNPGPAGIAIVVNITNSITREKTEHVLARPVGIRTNNQAEYMALVVGVKYATTLGATGLEIYTDSKLILHQMKDEWYVREKTLYDLRHEARALLETSFKGHWSLTWVSREKNQVADRYCTEAILCNNPWIPNLLDPFRPKKRKPIMRGYNYEASLP